MKKKAQPLRVAVVQMYAHLAFEGRGKLFLKEPLSEPYISQLHAKLPPDSPLLRDIERLQQSIARAYNRALLARVEAILRYCASHGAHLVIFPEYSIPGSLLSPIRTLAANFHTTVVAGTHLVTNELLGDPTYRACFADAPPGNHAIAPVVAPLMEDQIRYQLKLWPSQWEPALSLGTTVERFECNGVSLGVAICIDFIRHRDKKAAKKHNEWSKRKLIVVTSATPGDTPRAFVANAEEIYREYQIPVAFANLASGGGSTIVGHSTRNEDEPLAPDSMLPPLPASYEGICIAELRLDRPAKLRPTPLEQVTSIQPLAYALIRPFAEDPELASAAEALGASATTEEFKQRCADLYPVLVRAANDSTGIELVRRRWSDLAKGAIGCEGLAALKRLASDLWLPDDVLSLPEIEHALADGSVQVLQGIVSRDGVPAQDRRAIDAAIHDIETTAGRLQVDEGNLQNLTARALVAEVVSVLLPQAESAAPPTLIRPDGSVERWILAPGSPPPELVQLGFSLWPRVAFDEALTENSPQQLSSLRDLQAVITELDHAATSLALQGFPPAWIGWSPNRTPCLVVPPGHIVLASSIIPSEADLRLARGRAGKPLPVALLLGDSDGLQVKLPPRVVPLDKAIRKLAVDPDHLEFLTDFEYSEQRRNFVEPRCTLMPNGPAQRGRAALDQWLASDQTIAVLCGAIGDGRTTLVRTWLIDKARDALIRDGLPILYVNGDGWRTRTHISELLNECPPERLAALRLAVWSGRCLLVLDGFDDISPRAIFDHPFFQGWIFDPRGLGYTTIKPTRVLHVSCWPASRGELISLLPANTSDQWLKLHLFREGLSPPRNFIIRATTRDEIDHPPLEMLERHLLDLDSALRGVMGKGGAAHNPLEFLEDLAFSLWAPRPLADGETHSTIREDVLRRCRSKRRHRGIEREPAVDFLAAMRQPIVSVSRAPLPASNTSTWNWRQRRDFLRGLGEKTPYDRYYNTRCFGFTWDAMFHYFLAIQIVQCLTKDDPSILDLLPFHKDTVDYCRQHPGWRDTHPQLSRILRGRDACSTAAAVNALILANSDPSLGSSEDAPWILDELDLRCIDLTRARLDHASLKGANLSYGSLRFTTLCHANLSDARLEGCDLTDADLTGARISRAKITGATVERTKFRHCELNGTDLSRSTAHHEAPIFDGAILDRVILHALDRQDLGLTPEQYNEADVAWLQSTPQCPEEILVSPRISGGAIAWSTDDHIIATGDRIGRLWLWSSGPVRCLAVTVAHRGPIRSIAFSSDNTLIATAGDDTWVRVWRCADLTQVRQLPHANPATGVYFEASDVLWSFAKSPHRYELNSQKPPTHIDWIDTAHDGALISDGKHLVTVMRPTDGEYKFAVYDLAERMEVASVPSRSADIASIDVRNGRVIIDSPGDIHVRALLPPGKTQATMTTDNGYRGVRENGPKETWSGDGQSLAYVDRDRSIVVWDDQSARTRRLLATADGTAVRFSHLLNRLCVAKTDSISVIDVPTESVWEAPQARRFYHCPPVFSWNSTGILVHCSHHIITISLTASSFRICESPRRRESMMCRDLTGDLLLYVDGAGHAVWNETRQSVTFLDFPVSYTPENHGGPREFWSADSSLVAIQLVSPARGAQCCIWWAATGGVCFFERVPRSGSMIICDGETLRPMINCMEAQCVYLLDVHRRAWVTIQGVPQGRVYGGARGEHLAFIDQGRDLHMVLTDGPRAELERCSAGNSVEVSLPSVTHWRRRFTENIREVAMADQHDLMAILTTEQVYVLRLSHDELLQSFQIDPGVATLSFSPSGRHLACFCPGEIQFWEVAACRLVGRVFLLQDGALGVTDANGVTPPQFQRLSSHDGSLPSMEGFYARAGVNLWPLGQFTDLESHDLCANLWTTLMSADEPT